ncbi:hypothetical protein KR018_002463 [Drosophila ironensis]|nr:hypothetical protein KR018_002463 [Drosophila ironensis]
MDAATTNRIIPRFTRYWITVSVVLSVFCRLEVVPLHMFYLDRTLVLEKLQLWRCVTSLFVFPLTVFSSIHFVINIYFIVEYSSKLERKEYGRRPADYLFLLILAAVGANIGGLMCNMEYLMDIMVMTITYVWCSLNPNTMVTSWFGTLLESVYLPWMLVAFELMFKLSVNTLMGIVNGYVYFFFKYQYMEELGGVDMLITPPILRRLFPDIEDGFVGLGEPPLLRAPPRREPPPVFRGRGNTLGRD